MGRRPSEELLSEAELATEDGEERSQKLFIKYPEFVQSWKTWKSHGILKSSFPGLEKSWKKLKS